MLDLHALAPCYVFYFLLICPLFSFGFWKIGLFADACLCLGMLMPQDLCTTVPLHRMFFPCLYTYNSLITTLC